LLEGGLVVPLQALDMDFDFEVCEFGALSFIQLGDKIGSFVLEPVLVALLMQLN
jgi:hypothetical protein